MEGSAKLNGNTKVPVRAAVVFAILLVSVPAWAGSILDVDAGDAGTLAGIHSQRGKGHLAAKGIDITQIVSGSDILPVVMGRMSFTSGAITGMKPGERLFGPGGALSVTGCVAQTGGCLPGALITADFVNAMLVEKSGQFFLEAEVLETINPALAALLNLPKTTYKAELELALVRLGRSRWEVEGGSLNIISEPASIFLTGLALLALFAAKRYAHDPSRGSAID